MGTDLFHGASIVSQNRQEVNELSDLLFGVSFVHIQSATVIGNLTQRTIQRKVEHIAFLLHDLSAAIVLFDSPRALHSECCLEVGFGTLQISQHEDTSPGFHSDTSGQLAAGEGNCLRGKGIAHGLLNRGQSIQTDTRLCSCTNIDFVIVEECVLLLIQEVLHGETGSHIR